MHEDDARGRAGWAGPGPTPARRCTRRRRSRRAARGRCRRAGCPGAAPACRHLGAVRRGEGPALARRSARGSCPGAGCRCRSVRRPVREVDVRPDRRVHVRLVADRDARSTRTRSLRRGRRCRPSKAGSTTIPGAVERGERQQAQPVPSSRPEAEHGVAPRRRPPVPAARPDPRRGPARHVVVVLVGVARDRAPRQPELLRRRRWSRAAAPPSRPAARRARRGTPRPTRRPPTDRGGARGSVRVDDPHLGGVAARGPDHAPGRRCGSPGRSARTARRARSSTSTSSDTGCRRRAATPGAAGTRRRGRCRRSGPSRRSTHLRSSCAAPRRPGPSPLARSRNRSS